ncbi:MULTISPECIES: recombinase family protein [Bacillaceae]|uniref:Recombinase family protein n=1 Tax=Evansella alkalicola TaxID=745819 RepID=A0ABS6JXA8_9BACI|nr:MULTISPECIES: recombinase family protein [Bacillaceae]MBU9723138.1 recombinase family protein [Bacillus alkalicola]
MAEALFGSFGQRVDGLSLMNQLEEQPKLLRVAAYVRVSSLSDEQEGSFDNQKMHYTQLIRSTPGWKMVDIYVDQGRTGTSMDKRPGFNRLIRHAKERKIDVILCKSVSRFARNVIDSINTIRELTELGVRIIFDKENIDTGDMTSEFILTMLSATAQEESRSISENINWAVSRRFERGEPVFCRKLGYRQDAYKRWVVIEEEAQIVREAFEEVVKGKRPSEIAREFIKKGYEKINGRTDWSSTTVRLMLLNRDYTGDVICQKSYTECHLSHKQVANKGERNQFLIRNHHEPIVTRELFEAAQQALEKRKKPNRNKKANRYPLSSRIECSNCGGTLHRFICRGFVRWRCENNVKSKELCPMKSITEATIMEAMQAAFLQRYGKTKYVYDTQRMEKDLSRAVSARDLSYNRLRLDLEKILLEENITLINSSGTESASTNNKLEALACKREEIEKELKVKEEWWQRIDQDATFRDTAQHKLQELEGVRDPLKLLQKELEQITFLRAWVVRVKTISPMSFCIKWIDDQETIVDLRGGAKLNE